MKNYLLVFASDNKYLPASNRLIYQAEKLNVFDEIIFIEPNSFPDYFIDFINSNNEFFKNNLRGFGYWLWKPFLVNWCLNNKLGENDILVYLDSGCEISSLGSSIFLDYLSLANKKNGVFFNTKFKEKYWTKMDLIQHLGSHSLLNSKQIQATFFFIKNTRNNRVFTQRWFDISISNNYHFIDDSISELKNLDLFIEHRHDQSILSLLVKNANYHIIDSDCFFDNKLYYRDSYILKFPIHALRNLRTESVLDDVIKISKFENVSSSTSKIKFIIINSLISVKQRLYKIYSNIKNGCNYSF